jgi:DNA-directed RNA polymerase
MFNIITDGIPIQYQKHIASLMNELSWYWHDNTSYSNTSNLFQEMQILQQRYPNIVDNGQFTHAILDDGHVFSSDVGLLVPILYMFADKAGIVVKDILRIRINLMVQDKSFTYNNFNFPHTDVIPSKVFLYYVNDSDGDTILFNETISGKGEPLPSQFNIVKRIPPKAGTGVFFDGARFHASSNPANHKTRYVINFNFI